MYDKVVDRAGRYLYLARRVAGKGQRAIGRHNDAHRHVALKPVGPSRGHVLLSYILEPFLAKKGQPPPHWHSNYSESLEMAQTFLDLGYNVDVISWDNNSFLPSRKDYTAFVDVRSNLERLSPLLDPRCVKIQHIDVAHILFQNFAESRRLLDLQQRKGVTLPPRRFEFPNLAIEHADYATILGNKFTMDTFAYAHKPLYPVPIITPVLYPWPDKKAFDACRKRFLWFGSGGFVRKGLDLVLDAFAAMPEYELTICGPLDQEKDFEKAFYKELYRTPNIHTVGWVDVASTAFTDIVNSCIGLIFPSSCEGQSGGVVASLQASLIPIISYESGVDVDDFGVILPSCSIEDIKDAVRSVSNLPAAELESKARKAWEYARAHHTRERFAQVYRKTIGTIMAT